MATAILDIDGTLVDTNYHHAIAWYRAFRAHGFVLPLWRIHRHIGMGGDQLVAALAGEGFDREHGDDVRAAEKVLYAQLIDEVQPLAGARALIEDLKGARPRVILASSAKPEELEHYLTLLDARSLVDDWTDSGDVDATKPEPDLVLAALEKAGATPKDAVMIGDSTWDCHAAKAAKVRSIGVLTGGFSESELLDAGASKVFPSVEDLRPRLDETSCGFERRARADTGPPRPAREASGATRPRTLLWILSKPPRRPRPRNPGRSAAAREEKPVSMTSVPPRGRAEPVRRGPAPADPLSPPR